MQNAEQLADFPSAFCILHSAFGVNAMKTIPRVERVHATVTAPPSKSYSVRALLLGAMSAGSTTITNCLDADDTRYALEALRTIGFQVSGTFKGGVTIGERISMSANDVDVFIGNAGTAMRFLTGWLAFTPGRFILRGEERMHNRPIGDLVEVLLSIGAEVEYVEKDGYPPLRIRGKRMRGGFEVSIAADTSSQFASSLMLAGATLPGGLTVHLRTVASAPYIDVTADILRAFGAEVERDGNSVTVRASRLARDEYHVEGDYSSASYWLAAAAATNGEIRIGGVVQNSAQGDARFIDILERMGCTAEWSDGVTLRGPRQLRGGTFDCNGTPDLVPTLAAIAPLAS
ncbi:MAG TPA: 3-phosphoshikimate 1-carboxyvinyltransferase, partial [Thermoanaerobaculia bacterium]